MLCDRCGEDHAEIVTANPEDVPDFLRKLLGGGEPDPEAEAQTEMDRAVAVMLHVYWDRVAGLEASPSNDPAVTRVLTTPSGASAIAKNMAGGFMFNNDPAAIAYAAALLAARYAALLDQWATLYVAAARADTPLVIDLDSAKTAEAKDAVTRAGGPDRFFGSDAHGGTTDGFASVAIDGCTWPDQQCQGHESRRTPDKSEARTGVYL